MPKMTIPPTPGTSKDALQTVDNALTLALLAASLASQLANVTGFLATVHQEGRVPTDEEVKGFHDAYDEARNRALANADRIEAQDRADTGDAPVTG